MKVLNTINWAELFQYLVLITLFSSQFACLDSTIYMFVVEDSIYLMRMLEYAILPYLINPQRTTLHGKISGAEFLFPPINVIIFSQNSKPVVSF